MSQEGKTYTVNIYDKSYTGSITTLKCGPEPFLTQEDDSEEYFLSVRSQTGYLRIIDDTESGMLMEELVPDNNTQRMVKLFNGDTVEWQGFIQSQAYSQPWDKQAKLIEFPIKSILGALEDVKLTKDDFDSSIPLVKLVEEIEIIAGIRPFEYLVVASDLADDPLGTFMTTYIDTGVFFEQESEQNQGLTTISVVGVSFSDALTYVMNFYGYVMREKGTTLYILQYDHPGSVLNYSKTSWADFADKSWTAGTTSQFSDVDMLPALSFRGDENTIGFTQGASIAKIDFQFDNNTSGIQLPNTEETADELIQIKVDGDYCMMYVQPHEPPELSYAKYNFSRYNKIKSGQAYDYQGESDYNSVLAHSLLKGYRDWVLEAGTAISYGELYTGSFPVRFYYKQSENAVINLSTGLWINLQYASFFATEQQILATTRPVFAINSISPINFVDGFVNIQFGLDIFHLTDARQADLLINHTNKNFRTHMMFRLSVDNKIFWNDKEKKWTEENSYFTIDFNAGEIESNRTDDMKVDETNGYFVPISGVKGTLYLEIHDGMSFTINGGDDFIHTFAYAAILHNLEVKYLPTYNATASSRNSNVYQTVIATNGFTAEKKIDENIGTINNNQDNAAFIRNKDGEYIEAFDYAGKSTTINERPELHLLNRVAKYYSKSRRIISAKVKNDLDLMLSRYKYNNRLFFGLDSEHNWRDDSQNAKFLEVTGDDE